MRKIKQPIKIVFFGSRPISIKALDILIDYDKKKIDRRIDITVVTNSDDDPPKGVSKWWKTGILKEVAKKNNLKVLTSFSGISNESFDLGINVFSTDIIPESIIKSVSGGIINIHFGYLPTIGYSKLKGSPHRKGEPYSKGTYRGSNVLSHAILNKEEWQAVTLHFISKKIDLGPVIDIMWNRITGETTAWDLQKASEDKALILFNKYLPLLIDNPQKIVLSKPGSSKYPYYNRPLLQEIKVLNPDISYRNLELTARALSFPNTEPPYFIENNWKGEILKRYVIYKKGQGLIVRKPRKDTFIQKLTDIT